MKRGKLVAIGIGIAVAMMASFALAISAQSGQADPAMITQTPEGRHFTVELKESVGVRENPGPP